MSVSVLINSYDLQAAFGVFLEDGGLDRFEIPPLPREPFFNEWQDESGRDYDDTSDQVYQSQSFEVPFLLVGSSMVDYRQKKREFLELINFNGEFDFQILDWGEAFKLRYKSTSSWELLNVGLESETSARFVLIFECNFKPTYVFKYLADNQGRYIVINDNQRMLVKTVYNSNYGK